MSTAAQMQVRVWCVCVCGVCVGGEYCTNKRRCMCVWWWWGGCVMQLGRANAGVVCVYVCEGMCTAFGPRKHRWRGWGGMCCAGMGWGG